MPDYTLTLLTVLALGLGTSFPAQVNRAPNCEQTAESTCLENFSNEAGQCDGYYLQRTEANRLCHESANQRRLICVERASRECGEDTGNPSPKSRTG